MKYRKTALIEAEQFDRDKQHHISEEFRAAVCWKHDSRDICDDIPDTERADRRCVPHVHTLEGAHRINDLDWIIRGIKGEFYPCKPDIFAATYEPVSEAPTSDGQVHVTSDTATTPLEAVQRATEGSAYAPIASRAVTERTNVAERICPECRVERADYEGEGKHLPTCSNCGSERFPSEPPSEAPAKCQRCGGSGVQPISTKTRTTTIQGTIFCLSCHGTGEAPSEPKP